MSRDLFFNIVMKCSLSKTHIQCTFTSKETTVKESMISSWILYKYWTYFSGTKPAHPSNTSKPRPSCQKLKMKTEYEWLQSVSLNQDVFNIETVSWSSYDSKKDEILILRFALTLTITSLLPWLQNHFFDNKTCHEKNKENKKFLNPVKHQSWLQTSLYLYCLAKQI
jgi:hypothetical protein